MQSGNLRLLRDKTLVVMGGTTGIGLSASRAMVSAGARVCAVGLDEQSVGAAANVLGDGALVFRGDATRAETAELAVRRALELGGKIHGLYHVAGGSGRRMGDGPLDELTDGGWDATLRLNLTSVMYSNRAAVRQFMRQGTGGVVVNVTSVLASSPVPHHFATMSYAAAKAGIVGLTKSCAAHYASRNIRFNAIAPGLVRTPMSRRAQESAEILGYAKAKQPLGDGGLLAPEALDMAAVWLFSDAGACVTGQVITVDGGWTVSEPKFQTQ